MYSPKTRPQFLPKEADTRAMVAFLDNFIEIKSALAELDKARADANAAEEAAKTACKEADLTVAKANELHNQVVATANALADKQAQLDKGMQVALAMKAEFEGRLAAQKVWEDVAAKKEAEFKAKCAALQEKLESVESREKAIAERELKLEAKLNAFKEV